MEPASHTVHDGFLNRKGVEESQSHFTEVFSWGNDRYGQLGLGEKFASGKQLYMMPKRCSFNIAIAEIACGNSHTVFLTPSQLVYSMGSNQFGELGINESHVKVKYSPTLIESLIGKCPLSLSCGERHTMVLCMGQSEKTRQPHGQVYAWGHNLYGQCGVGGTPTSFLEVIAGPRLIDLY